MVHCVFTCSTSIYVDIHIIEKMINAFRSKNTCNFALEIALKRNVWTSKFEIFKMWFVVAVNGK